MLDFSVKKRFVTIEKEVGKTPLQCVEKLRNSKPYLNDVSLAYAGRLDPMASGKLLILIGDECKKQTNYHSLDKKYEFQVLFGLSSDTKDVLGILNECDVPKISEANLRNIAKKLTGTIELPYPHFSSKTVQGKPLHIWALENRLNEIIVPTKKSTIYKLKLTKLETISKESLYRQSLEKINSISPVTEKSKALGADFRRIPIRKSWKKFYNTTKKEEFTVATFSCTASSGTYMRTLAEVIAKETSTCGLAFKIHRTIIGKYYKPLRIWTKRY